MPNKAIHPSRRSATNLNHSFGADWVIAAVTHRHNRHGWSRKAGLNPHPRAVETRAGTRGPTAR